MLSRDIPVNHTWYLRASTTGLVNNSIPIAANIYSCGETPISLKKDYKDEDSRYPWVNTGKVENTYVKMIFDNRTAAPVVVRLYETFTNNDTDNCDIDPHSLNIEKVYDTQKKRWLSSNEWKVYFRADSGNLEVIRTNDLINEFLVYVSAGNGLSRSD